MSDLIGNEESMMYVSTFEGKFVIKVSEHTPNAVTRTNKNGKVVHEKQFNVINGTIVDISEKDSDFGKRWMFTIEAGGKKLSLESSQKGSLATTIINRLPNMNIAQPIKIKIAYNASKERTMFFVSQNDTNVEDKYQKWNKESKEWERFFAYPSWEKVMIDGEEKYDASKQIAFGKKVVKKYFADAYVAAVPVVEKEPAYEEPSNPDTEEEDDIPF